MNKFIQLIISLILISTHLLAQNHDNLISELDTIEVFDGYVQVDYKIYRDSKLITKTQGFIFPDTVEWKKNKWLIFSKQTKYIMDSLVLHGENISSFDDGKYSVGHYRNGKKIIVEYFNKNGEKISRSDIYGHNPRGHDPESGIILRPRFNEEIKKE